MKGQDDFGLKNVVVGRAELFHNDESFKREQIRCGIARHRTDPLHRPSVREICVHCHMVAARVSHSHSFTAATGTVA
ncbi:hypothetical protein GCM10009544_57360 [Streptomyces stramineus]|uniref:Uncharacterized protein n=1 Tax=Streptomyces stramineus TaxID=173861 RepID=A0ABP3KX32_9ACTN